MSRSRSMESQVFLMASALFDNSDISPDSLVGQFTIHLKQIPDFRHVALEGAEIIADKADRGVQLARNTCSKLPNGYHLRILHLLRLNFLQFSVRRFKLFESKPRTLLRQGKFVPITLMTGGNCDSPSPAAVSLQVDTRHCRYSLRIKSVV